jgi:hypothetical protein
MIQTIETPIEEIIGTFLSSAHLMIFGLSYLWIEQDMGVNVIAGFANNA